MNPQKRFSTGTRVGLVSLLSVLVVAAGCGGGPGVGKVSGKVTYKGQPLAGGWIVFTVENGGGANAPIQQDGSYVADNVPAGKAKVCFRAPVGGSPFEGAFKNLPPEARAKRAKELEQRAKPPASASEHYKAPTAEAPSIQLPKQYTDPDKSGIVYDVQRGTQTKDFELN
jgi:hypothetical protein